MIVALILSIVITISSLFNTEGDPMKYNLYYTPDVDTCYINEFISTVEEYGMEISSLNKVERYTLLMCYNDTLKAYKANCLNVYYHLMDEKSNKVILINDPIYLRGEESLIKSRMTSGVTTLFYLDHILDANNRAMIISISNCASHYGFITTVLHEFGHWFGLGHCGDIRCLMSPVQTEITKTFLCKQHRKEFKYNKHYINNKFKKGR